MKIGVLSDTHNHLSNLIHALEELRDRDITTIIHCGDLTDHDLVGRFEGFRVIYTFGNGDFATGTIRNQLNKMNPDSTAAMVFRGALDGVRVAATHSHMEGKVMDLIRERKFKWVFHGHTHEKRDEVIRGVRVVNPGALGGAGRGPRSFCMVDLDAENVTFLEV
jgi:hypothetical protein